MAINGYLGKSTLKYVVTCLARAAGALACFDFIRAENQAVDARNLISCVNGVISGTQEVKPGFGCNC